MIKLRDSSILVVGADGRSVPFEAEDLQTRIIKACLSSGNKDLWIAQDISLSVEFAIVSQSQDSSSSIRASELDSLVAKILEETGYSEVAEKFRKASPKPDLLDARDSAGISGLLAKRLLLSDASLDNVLGSTLEALKVLGIEHCSPQLALELGRHFKDSSCDSSIPLKAPESVLVPAGSAKSFLAESQELAACLPETLRRIIQPRPLSRLFPALAVDVRLVPFVELLGLERPLTELPVLAKLELLTEALDNLCGAADKLCAERGRGDSLPLPLWINMADLSVLSSEWMECVCDVSSAPALEIASALFSSLSRTPFKTTLS